MAQEFTQAFYVGPTLNAIRCKSMAQDMEIFLRQSCFLQQLLEMVLQGSRFHWLFAAEYIDRICIAPEFAELL